MSHDTIKKVLIANRGEIALRIIRACNELEIQSVAICSTADTEAYWVKKAHERYPIIDQDPIAVYLNYERIISIAKRSHCDAIQGMGSCQKAVSSRKRSSMLDLSLLDPDLNIYDSLAIRSLMKWAILS